ncbi:putative glucose ribitol dehydrogenase [Rosellinia necatrix]|uniref:Putative glucose ribitol dehydrogenase n=1 Tax=Rosellinia necatrix TaxID=77044 RepID=A0A1S8A9B2_ROSNE|nr:putative glucose ribitol dehydrogenase [Rosellinia necatrix]
MEGFRNFKTQTWPPSPTFTSVPAGSQTGRVFIVTGGNTGIGFELCKLLFGSGATIYMASRSKDKAAEAIQTIEASIPEGAPGRGRLRFLHLDLGDLRSVKTAAADFAAREPRLDVLWNNAGIGANVLKHGARTAQDLEVFMGVHCVATLLFTTLLLPQLKAASAAAAAAAGGRAGAAAAAATRVVWTASGLMDSAAPAGGVDFATLEGGIRDRVANYGQSKAGTWFLGREFARRYGGGVGGDNGGDGGEGGGILSVTLNPGNLRAGSFKGTAAPLYLVLSALMLHEPVFGAYTELYAGLSPELTPAHNGTYIIPWGRRRPDAEITRKDILAAMAPRSEGGLGHAERLWAWCEEKWRPYV